MNTVKKYGLIAISLLITALGYLTLWFLLPLVINKFGGINPLSSSLIMFFSSFFILTSIYLFRHAQGKPPKKWFLEIILTYQLLAVFIALSFIYDAVLPANIPFIWRYIILPMTTIVIIFHVLRRIPTIRKRLDKLAEELGW